MQREGTFLKARYLHVTCHKIFTYRPRCGKTALKTVRWECRAWILGCKPCWLGNVSPRGGKGEPCYFPPSSLGTALASKMPIRKVSRNTSSLSLSRNTLAFHLIHYAKLFGDVEWRSLMSWLAPPHPHPSHAEGNKQTNEQKIRNLLYISAQENASSGHAPKQPQQQQQQ